MAVNPSSTTVPAMFDDNDESVAIDNVACLVAADLSFRFKFLASPDYQEFEHWVAKKLIVRGVQWKVGLTSTLTIPDWLWRRILGEHLRTGPPPCEFETDRYFQKLLLLCKTRDAVGAKELFDLLGPMYLAMRRELREEQNRLRNAYEELVEIAESTPEFPAVEGDLLAIADGMMPKVEFPDVKAPPSIGEAFDD